MHEKAQNEEADRRLANDVDEVDEIDEAAAVKGAVKELKPKITLKLVKQVVTHIAEFKKKAIHHTGEEARNARGDDFPTSPLVS
jgi:hypothetical protein